MVKGKDEKNEFSIMVTTPKMETFVDMSPLVPIHRTIRAEGMEYYRWEVTDCQNDLWINLSNFSNNATARL